MKCARCRWPARHDGLCTAHWLPPVPARPKGLRERFEAKVTKADCWQWTAATNAAGYGMFSVHSRPSLAHRVSYELHIGPIPDGLSVRQRCANRGCVNPDHLEAVTTRGLLLHSKAPTAVANRTNRCLKGHEFTPDNTRIRQGRRECRQCVRARERAYIRKG